MNLNRYTLQDIKSKLDKIEHCGDYGTFWLHKVEPKIFLELGDSDDISFEYPGFEVIIGKETGPPDPDTIDWFILSYGTEVYELLKYDIVSGKSYVEKEKHVKLLDLNEYHGYYNFFKQLKD